MAHEEEIESVRSLGDGGDIQSDALKNWIKI